MNNNPLQKNTLEEQILEKIKKGKIQMKTKTHFVLKNVLVLFVSILVFCVSALLVSYIIFSIQTSNQIILLGFGIKGIELFFILFPWLVFLIDIILILILNALLRDFKISYRMPLIQVIAIIFILTILGGVALNDTHIHDNFMKSVEEGNFSALGSLYENLRKSLPSEGIFKGKIIAINNDSITIKHNDADGDKDDWTQIVNVSDSQLANLQVGNNVFVYAHYQNGFMVARGIQKIDINK